MLPVDLTKEFAFGHFNSLAEAFGNLILPAFSFAGIGVLVYFIIGAFRYITSGGDKEKLAGARNMITHAIIGFILLIMMFAIIQFIPQALRLGDFRVIQGNP